MDIRRYVTNPAFLRIGIGGGIIAAYQAAGAPSMTLAMLILGSVWLVCTLETWYSEWINRIGLYKASAFLATASIYGLVATSIGLHIALLKADQTIPSLTVYSKPPPLPIIIAPPVAESKKPSVPIPSVSLRFIYPKAPALQIVNESDAIVRDIKWSVVLWNLDIPDRNDPLQIPTSSFDWLRPHRWGGPQDLFSRPAVAQLLKPGNRLLGSAAVICPECDRGRTYIVYIVWKEGGWFWELKDETSGNALIPRSFADGAKANFFQALEEMAPDSERIAIGDGTVRSPNF
jgi:hypothetical protein